MKERQLGMDEFGREKGGVKKVSVAGGAQGI